MSTVLDSSITLASVYPDEITAAIQLVMEEVIRGGAWVPAIWRLEVANALEMGVRRGRISSAFRDASLHDLASMWIRTDSETDTQAWGATLRLADKHRLTLYDASYLELTLRRNLPLAGLDNELRSAALSEKIELLGV
jgi:predicted nucleic acid-binding protein